MGLYKSEHGKFQLQEAETVLAFILSSKYKSFSPLFVVSSSVSHEQFMVFLSDRSKSYVQRSLQSV